MNKFITASVLHFFAASLLIIGLTGAIEYSKSLDRDAFELSKDHGLKEDVCGGQPKCYALTYYNNRDETKGYVLFSSEWYCEQAIKYLDEENKDDIFSNISSCHNLNSVFLPQEDGTFFFYTFKITWILALIIFGMFLCHPCSKVSDD